MSDMTDDKKGLDNYGVWVKKPPRDIGGEEPAAGNSLGEMDLPDFADLDLSTEDSSNNDDIFNDLDFTSTAEDLQDDGAKFSTPDTNALDIPSDDFPIGNAEYEDFNNGDTSLSPDELANITMGHDMETVQEDAMNTMSEGISDMESAALSSAFLADSTTDDNADLTIGEDIDLSSSDPDLNIDDSDLNIGGDMALPNEDEFSIDEPSANDDTIVSEESAVTENAGTDDVDLGGFDDGEIDLGSFMSDSGDGEISFEDGDIDLGDFMGEGFGGGSSSKEPAEIQDERTLDIKVDFDEDAKTIAVEDTPENEAAMMPKVAASAQDDTSLNPSGAAEEMFNSFDAAVAAVGIPEPSPGGDTTQSGDDTLSSSEDGEIDLSEFGFDDDDSNIGMTNGPEGANPVHKAVVDYDMRVTVDEDSKTPPVLDVINGKISADETDNYYEEDETKNNMEETKQSANTASPEISEKGKEILEQIMGELASLKDEIKSIKGEFAELQSRPVAAPAPQLEVPTPKKEENTGFFAEDDGNDTIALSGNEMANILSSAQFSEEEPTEEEPLIEENTEPEMEETAVDENDIAMDMPSDQTEIEEQNLPDEISVPKSEENFNSQAIDDYMAEDKTVEDSLTDEKLNYLGETPVIEEPQIDESADPTESGVPSVDEIMQDNISMQDDDAVGIGVGDDINAAFDEADADESDIMDDSLAAKDNYEDSVSDIMSENISMQNGDQEEVEAGIGIGVGDDINAAFDEADADESDIMDDSLAAKDAYEKEINKSIEDEKPVAFEEPSFEEPTVQEPVVDEPQIEEPSFEEPTVQEPVVDEPQIDEPQIDEPTIEEPAVEEPQIEEPMEEDTIAETSVEEPTVNEDNFEEPTIQEPPVEPTIVQTTVTSTASEAASIPKGLKNEIISVLSYMDQLLENLPEDKITEFAKSEHFATYKKLFDELGLS